MGFLCRLGLHSWSRPKYSTSFSSNVRDWNKRCVRCGKVKRWVEAK